MQISSPINLIGGEFYFMQAIMKAGEHTYDHLGVGVRQPDGQNCKPILNDYLYVEIPGKVISKPLRDKLFIFTVLVMRQSIPAAPSPPPNPG